MQRGTYVMMNISATLRLLTARAALHFLRLQLIPTHIAAKMPTTKATEAISQIEADHSKILGLRIGSHDVQLDQHIPVAGWSLGLPIHNP